MLIHQRAAALLHWAATVPVEDTAAGGDEADSVLLLQQLDLHRPSVRGAMPRTPESAAARVQDQGSAYVGAAAQRSKVTVAQLFLPEFVASFDGAPHGGPAELPPPPS